MGELTFLTWDPNKMPSLSDLKSLFEINNNELNATDILIVLEQRSFICLGKVCLSLYLDLQICKVIVQ